jgi:hypothetical protein
VAGEICNSAQHRNSQLALTMMRSLPNTEELFARAGHFEALAQTWDAIAVLSVLAGASADPACKSGGYAFVGLMRRYCTLLAASGNDEPPFLFKHAKLALRSK